MMSEEKLEDGLKRLMMYLGRDAVNEREKE